MHLPGQHHITTCLHTSSPLPVFANACTQAAFPEQPAAGGRPGSPGKEEGGSANKKGDKKGADTSGDGQHGFKVSLLCVGLVGILSTQRVRNVQCAASAIAHTILQTVLLLDAELSSLPWEAIPFLRTSHAQLSRATSLYALRAAMQVRCAQLSCQTLQATLSCVILEMDDVTAMLAHTTSCAVLAHGTAGCGNERGWL